MAENESFLNVENLLTWIGVFSLVISALRIIIYWFDKSSYANVKIRFFETALAFNKEKANYPIIEELYYNDNSSVFLVGAIDYPITKIKIYDLQVRDKILKTNIKPVDRFINENYFLKAQLKKELPRDLLPGEYLMIQCNAPEGIPPRKISFRVNGKIVEYDFQFNGIYGNRNIDYIKEKHDFTTLLYHWFKM